LLPSELAQAIFRQLGTPTHDPGRGHQQPTIAIAIAPRRLSTVPHQSATYEQFSAANDDTCPFEGRKTQNNSCCEHRPNNINNIKLLSKISIPVFIVNMSSSQFEPDCSYLNPDHPHPGADRSDAAFLLPEPAADRATAPPHYLL
jgi:hypothetical protein